MIQHHVEACKKVSCVSEVLIIGSYNAADIQPFADQMSRSNGLVIRYLQEFTPLGTAGAMYHFRDQIRAGGEESFFIFNGDVCADFPLEELLQYHKSKKSHLTIMSTEATRQQSLNYGCLVLDNKGCVAHYVEKPSTFVSTLISCGVYVASNEIFQTMADVLYCDRSQEKKT
jgi:mannose-1-phosphate guanylyltransferase